MKFWNHYKMGQLIYKSMEENGIRLKKTMFVYGNLAPDMCFSYIYRMHTKVVSASYLSKQLIRVYSGANLPESAKFSYCLGVMSHYICDFLCYPHTTAFNGGTHEHYMHEKKQTVEADDLLPLNKKKCSGLNFILLTDMIDRYISRREKLYGQNAEMKYGEISFAMYVAAWASSNAYLYAEQSFTASALAGSGAPIHDIAVETAVC